MTTAEATLVEEMEVAGFAMVRQRAGEELLNGFLEAVEKISQTESKEGKYGVRGLLARSVKCRELAANPVLLKLVCAVLGPQVRAVKGIYFDKNPAANWLVPWHQDLTITVKERREWPGFGPWTVKDGIVHVQPPAEVMENILALRIHLDETGPDNGALRVLPGTHRRGRIPGAEIAGLAKEITTEVCAASRGDILLMRPLLLHSSLPSVNPAHRRVIHLEYTAQDLPGGLEWFG